MKVGDKVTMDGKEYRVLKAGVTKAEAVRSRNWQHKGGFRARIQKVSRGNYLVLVG